MLHLDARSAISSQDAFSFTIILILDVLSILLRRSAATSADGVGELTEPNILRALQGARAGLNRRSNAVSKSKGWHDVESMTCPPQLPES